MGTDPPGTHPWPIEPQEVGQEPVRGSFLPLGFGSDGPRGLSSPTVLAPEVVRFRGSEGGGPFGSEAVSEHGLLLGILACAKLPWIEQSFSGIFWGNGVFTMVH